MADSGRAGVLRSFGDAVPVEDRRGQWSATDPAPRTPADGGAPQRGRRGGRAGTLPHFQRRPTATDTERRPDDALPGRVVQGRRRLRDRVGKADNFRPPQRPWLAPMDAHTVPLHPTADPKVWGRPEAC